MKWYDDEFSEKKKRKIKFERESAEFQNQNKKYKKILKKTMSQNPSIF